MPREGLETQAVRVTRLLASEGLCDRIPANILRVHGEFVLTPPLVFDTAHGSVAASDTIGDSHLWTPTL